MGKIFYHLEHHIKFLLKTHIFLIISHFSAVEAMEKQDSLPSMERQLEMHQESDFSPAEFWKNSKEPESMGEKEAEMHGLNYFEKSLSFSRTDLPSHFHHLYQPIQHLNPSDADRSIRIDLHGKSVEQAEKTVINVIKQAKKLDMKGIHFICGRGKHKNAKGQRGTIFKAFPQWVMKESISSLIKSFQKGLVLNLME